MIFLGEIDIEIVFGTMTIKKLTLGNLAASFLTEFFGHAACAANLTR